MRYWNPTHHKYSDKRKCCRVRTHKKKICYVNTWNTALLFHFSILWNLWTHKCCSMTTTCEALFFRLDIILHVSSNLYCVHLGLLVSYLFFICYAVWYKKSGSTFASKYQRRRELICILLFFFSSFLMDRYLNFL